MLKSAQKDLKKKKKRKRSGFFKSIRKGKDWEPNSPFEENYKLCCEFKKFKGTPKEKLEKLKKLSCIVIKNNTQPYDKRRKKSHGAWKKKCFVCKKEASCQHHIIQLQNGGYDNGINRIPICDECHETIHPWMGKRV